MLSNVKREEAEERREREDSSSRDEGAAVQLPTQSTTHFKFDQVGVDRVPQRDNEIFQLESTRRQQEFFC